MADLAENKARLAGFRADAIALEAKLAELDIQREETRKDLEHMRLIIAHLAALCGERQDANLSMMGFTDAVRTVISNAYPNWVSAIDVRNSLSKQGYDLQPYANALASI